MEQSTMPFTSMLDLEERSPDRFAAATPPSPWGVLYGGQLVAQGLRAAAATAPDGQFVHSLHAYYIRPGDHTAPVELEVERVRDGRSFSVRSVVAAQGHGALARLIASFHVDENPEDVPGIDAPDVVQPDDLPPGGWNPMFERRYAPIQRQGEAHAWLRLNDDIGDDRTLQACALAFMADDIFDDAVRALLHPDRPPANDLESLDQSLSIQSLDYSVWFNRPIRDDGWRLHQLRCQSLANSCGMVVGEVFDERGAHLATLGQHLLVRPPRG